MRCVFDTNVFVSALLSPQSKPRQAIDLVLKKGKILLSFETLSELSAVLNRKRFRPYIDEEDIRRFLSALVRDSDWVDEGLQIIACRDPKDDKFLSLAVSGQATFLITGDADLLDLNPFQGIQIISPNAFLELHI